MRPPVNTTSIPRQPGKSPASCARQFPRLHRPWRSPIHIVGQVEQFSIPVPLQEYIKSLHEAISLFGIVRGSGVTRRAVAKRRRRTAPWPVPLLRLSGFFGLGFGVDPLARSAAVLYKSFFFSSLPIRKVLVLPFAGGVSPPLPVVSLLFSASYPQIRRSYYLFCTTCSSTTCICWRNGRRIEGECWRNGRRTVSAMLAEWSWKTPPIT